jgi:hypothetical protein
MNILLFLDQYDECLKHQYDEYLKHSRALTAPTVLETNLGLVRSMADEIVGGVKPSVKEFLAATKELPDAAVVRFVGESVMLVTGDSGELLEFA